MRACSNLLAPNSVRGSRSMAFEPEMLQKHLHKNRCRGVRLNRASPSKYVYLRRAAHPTVPTLSLVDERPHRTWSEQVATKCACCQGPSSGQRARAAAVAGRLGSLDECSQRYRGGHDAPPRHTSTHNLNLQYNLYKVRLIGQGLPQRRGNFSQICLSYEGKVKKSKRFFSEIRPASCEIWASKFADEGNEKRICAKWQAVERWR